MFRKALILGLVGAIVAVGAPVGALAQTQNAAGSISGRAIDATGRGVGSQRVELLYGAQVVSASQTNAFGEWAFNSVKPGEYVVRMNVMGRLSGVRVYVMGGQAVSGTMIVVSTASVSPQLGTLASLLTIIPTAATAVAATATAAAIETETTQLNDVILEKILQDLTPAQRVTFATAVLTAVAQSGATGSTSPFSQYVQQLQVIVSSGGNTVPDFPPPVAVS